MLIEMLLCEDLKMDGSPPNDKRQNSYIILENQTIVQWTLRK